MAHYVNSDPLQIEEKKKRTSSDALLIALVVVVALFFLTLAVVYWAVHDTPGGLAWALTLGESPGLISPLKPTILLK